MNLKTIREAAAALDVNEAVIRRAVKCGELSVMALGNRMLVDIDEAREVLVKPDGVTISVVSGRRARRDPAAHEEDNGRRIRGQARGTT